jgi:SAM-dependent methyltransferase
MWSEPEARALAPVLGRLQAALGPLDGKQALVLCSAGGDVVLELAQGVGVRGRVTGLELSPAMLRISRDRAAMSSVNYRIDLRKAERKRIPLPDASFDALASEFIVFPSPEPTEIGHPEMARVLRPGGRMALTDVIAPRPLPHGTREALRGIGLSYVRDASPADLTSWMRGAGMADVKVEDLTALVRPLWEARHRAATGAGPSGGLEQLLGGGRPLLGDGLLYILVSGRKP